jgi:hypothetical protein
VTFITAIHKQRTNFGFEKLQILGRELRRRILFLRDADLGLKYKDGENKNRDTSRHYESSHV